MANLTAYGFAGIADLASQQVTAEVAPVVMEAIRVSLAEYTRVLDEFMSGLVTKNKPDEWKIQYRLPGTHTLQPLDNKGTPLPVLPGGSYEIAFPIQGAGTAWGTDRISRALMTVADAELFTSDALAADADWMRRHILAALFTNVTWTYTDPRHGALTIQPLANGDTVTYVKRDGSVATDTHFLGQAAAIADATNPFPTIYTELYEHPSNTGPFIAYIASNLVATTEALADFVPVVDPDVNQGTGAVTLNNNGSPRFGDRVLGKVANMWVVEWGAIPSSYIIAHSANATDVLGMREYDSPALKGFFPEFNDVNGNLQEQRMLRYCGFGVRNRIGALAMEISDASYDVPTGYLAPLAV